MRKLVEGSRAVAEAVAMCRPKVISAYPITPQTHIVQELAQLVADGELEAEFVNVESEHSAASVVLGASATGVRAFTASTSQGLLLMNEVLYNIAGMRLPIVITGVNRAVSAPLNIWNDWQDTISVRDAGLIQFYAESNQEALDLHIQAFRVAEDRRILLPAMVCMDGYILTHAYEPLDLPTQEEVDSYLPSYQPLYTLDPATPVTMGAYAEPDKYTEARYMIQKAMEAALQVIEEAARGFQRLSGRASGGLVDVYRMEEAETAVVTMGSLAATAKETVDELRGQGQKVGVVRIITYRPFPIQALRRALGRARRAVVLEKAISLGSSGPLALDLKAALYGMSPTPAIDSFIAGLGGRDITGDTIRKALATAVKEPAAFLDLRPDLELEGVP